MTAQRRAAIESPLLTPFEAAAYMRMSRAWVWLHRLELGVILVGSKMRYTQAGLDAYLERNRQQPSSAAPTLIAAVREKRRPALKHSTPTNPLDGGAW
jgi:hypothetical protein